MQTVKLNFPFKIGGVPISEISYDYDNFTGDDYLAAIAARKTAPDQIANPVNDYTFMFQLGIGVILASNRGKGWTPADFLSLKGSDLWQITQVGLVFFGATPEEAPQETSGGLPEPSQSDSTAPSQS